jgi:DNA-directed RNA polymerase subunit M/transcription elongation factor TFIIS
MSGATYFVQECPTCGRRLQIRLEHLGKVVACKHCHGEFEATDAARMSNSTELLLRVDELLESVDSRRVRPR